MKEIRQELVTEEATIEENLQQRRDNDIGGTTKEGKYAIRKDTMELTLSENVQWHNG